MRRDGAVSEMIPEPPAAAADDLFRQAAKTVNESAVEWQHALLRPRAVALVGVGLDPDKPAGRPLRLLRRHGFEGAIYPVSSEHRLIQGAHTWPDLESLPGPADLALILQGGDTAIEAVAACGRAKIAVAMVAPLDPRGGDEFAVRLKTKARESGVRLVGPGAAAVVVPGNGLALSTEDAFGARTLPMGRFMLLAPHAGALGALFSRGAARGLGFRALVATGAEADLSLGEIGAAASDESDVDAFMLFVETIEHPAALMRFAAKAHAAGKPIVAYRRASAGRIRGEGPAPAEAFLRAHGIVTVEHLDTLLEVAPLLVGRRPTRGRTAAIVAAAPGTGVFAADRFARLGVGVDGLDDLARERLAQSDIALLPGPVMDVAGEPTASAIVSVLAESLDAPNNDVVLAVLGEAAETDPAGTVTPLATAARRADKPLAALVVPDAPEATRRLAEAGIAAFRTPETAADGLRAFLRWAAPHPPALMRDDEEQLAVVNRTLHAGQAMQIFRMLGVTIPTMLWVRRDSEMPRALPFPPPYVVKVLSPELEHRLDFGGVALGIETITGVQAAANAVTQRVRAVRPDVFLDGVMIQRLERGLAEVSIGFRRDKEAGPIVTLAMGEGLGETYGDSALRLAPLDRAQAYDMIDEVKGLTRIRGHRGRPRGDLEALAHSLVAISSFALIASPRVVEATIDPVLIKPEGQGVVALDGWMKTE